MNHILVVGGNTGREFSVVKKISDLSNYSISAYQWANNTIVANLTKQYTVGDVRDVTNIVSFAKKTKPDFVFIGQGESIEAGVVDALEKEGFPCSAPRKVFSQLEAEKKYSLELVRSIDASCVPATITLSRLDIDTIKHFIAHFGPKIVVKLDAKINSRGVHIFNMNTDTIGAIITFCKPWIQRGGEIMLQEFIEGHEFSIVTYTDGNHYIHSPVTKNYKPIYDNNQGAQTSGMGSITWHDENNIPNFPSHKIEKVKALHEKVLQKLQKKHKTHYKGALFGEFLITPTGTIKFIEFNVRFGNPSSINHFNLLEGNLFTFLHAIAHQKLATFNGSWKKLHSLTAYAVPKNYPYSKEYIGSSIDVSQIPPEALYYAFMNYNNAHITAHFSRLFAIGLVGKHLIDLNTKMNEIMKHCNGHIHWRRDIGTDL